MTQYTIRLKGGIGSGFHGHKGRPGQVGGSSSEGSSAGVKNDYMEIKRSYTDKHATVREQRAGLFNLKNGKHLVVVTSKRSGKSEEMTADKARHDLFNIEPQDEESPFIISNSKKNNPYYARDIEDIGSDLYNYVNDAVNEGKDPMFADVIKAIQRENGGRIFTNDELRILRGYFSG
jgi:hypothetical protein